ncbi:MAG: hypothetical protein K2Z81_10160 [Cyanobacteria bacterium]|nr:hypothetical protein [Cyanobacteriota bacterium]
MKRTILLGLAIAFTIVGTKASAHPAGWFLAGDSPKNYNWGIDKTITRDGQKAAYLTFTSQNTQPPQGPGFGTLMQSFSAREYEGKRLRFKGFMKTKDVSDEAALWMRIDGFRGDILNFDNMDDRQVKGTNDWKPYEIVLDVPRGSANISIGTLLSGRGQVWISGLAVEEVDKSIKPTAEYKGSYPDHPVDLDFGATQ